MTRNMLATLGALLSLVALGADAKTQAPHAVRLALEPGLALTFSTEWYACDADLNKSLHTKPLPEKIAAIVCRPIQGGGEHPIHLNNLLTRAPVSLVVDRIAMPGLSAEALLQATPDIAAHLNEIVCKEIGELLGVADHDVSACTASIVTVSQHPALLIRASIATGAKLREIRDYRVPYDQGELELQFESPANTDQASAAEVDAVIGSAEIEPGTFTPQTVLLTPAPGVSLSLPVGWIACDDATNALLGNRSDLATARQKSCTGLDPTYTRLRVFNPQLLQNVLVEVGYKTEKDITEEELAKLTPDRLADLSSKICDVLGAPITNGSKPVESCTVTADQIAGHAALLATLVFANEYDSGTKTRSRIYYVPYAQGFAILQFTVPILGEPVAQPLIDAVVKSVVIQ